MKSSCFPSSGQMPDRIDFSLSPQEWVNISTLLQSIYEKLGKTLQTIQPEKISSFLDPLLGTILSDAQEASWEIGNFWVNNPFYWIEKTQDFFSYQKNLFFDVADSLYERHEPKALSFSKDKRFKGELWQKNLFWYSLKEFYLFLEKQSYTFLQDVPNLRPTQRKRLQFFLQQIFNSIAPGNFPGTNPAVLEKMMKTGGLNFLKGFKNFLSDWTKNPNLLRISMTDLSAFQVGMNLASTPGTVLYQNDLMQLIYYHPMKEKVFQAPLLIIPPWINKYYILDLTEKNSLVRWALEQGHQVFMVSWVNPDEKLSQKSFEDYMQEGPLEALKTIKEYFDVPGVNVLGYCLGGTLLACTLAYLSKKGSDFLPIQSATLMTTLIDFQEAGDLGIFIEEGILDALETQMKKKGYLEGEILWSTFNFLKSQDLFWSFFEKNYLLGETPLPFDVLYWNSDSTRLPYEMQRFYLRNMYQKNLLAQQNGLTLCNVPLNLSEIQTPIFMVSTKEDHIAPWESTYKGAHLFKNLEKFILGGSGHVAGIVNSPHQNKYNYWENPSLLNTPQEWMSSATSHPGSWWPCWEKWITPYGGSLTPPKSCLKKPYPHLDRAPGSYVKFSCNS